MDIDERHLAVSFSAAPEFRLAPLSHKAMGGFQFRN